MLSRRQIINRRVALRVYTVGVRKDRTAREPGWNNNKKMVYHWNREEDEQGNFSDNEMVESTMEWIG